MKHWDLQPEWRDLFKTDKREFWIQNHGQIPGSLYSVMFHAVPLCPVSPCCVVFCSVPPLCVCCIVFFLFFSLLMNQVCIIMFDCCVNRYRSPCVLRSRCWTTHHGSHIQFPVGCALSSTQLSELCLHFLRPQTDSFYKLFTNCKTLTSRQDFLPDFPDQILINFPSTSPRLSSRS